MNELPIGTNTNKVENAITFSDSVQIQANELIIDLGKINGISTFFMPTTLSIKFINAPKDLNLVYATQKVV